MTRHIYLLLGWASVALGFLGVALPLLPTVPFMILAAFLFTRGSPRARAWLVDHPRFGAHIRRWEASGAISRRAKLAAVLSMGAVLALSLLMALPARLILIQAACMLPAALFVLTRPD